ncbi:MAG: UDP-glucose 4-epimerase GalE [Bacteroidia bacterium]|nr:UDP-glucose 4-epimerase GalE [Bacteroidia bacterium]
MSSGKKILVTGGTGYIGSHTAVSLIEQGYEVIIADNLINSKEEVLDAIEKITGKKAIFENVDLCDREATEKVFAKHKPDSLIHFAALKAVGESVEKPLWYYRNNLTSLLNTIELAIKHGTKNYVFSSSCSVYGEPDILPVSESAELKPAESPYANTKRISEEILRDTANVSSLKIICLRYFNPVGSHKSALIGEYPNQAPMNLMPVITQAAIGKRDQLKVFGSDYDTADGSCVRDYIHVVDLADAHLIATERMIKGNEKSNYEIFNIGTGTGLTVLQVIKAFEKYTGVKLNYEVGDRRPGDVEKVYANTNFAKKELGWESRLGIKEMVESAWAWEKHLKEKSK